MVWYGLGYATMAAFTNYITLLEEGEYGGTAKRYCSHKNYFHTKNTLRRRERGQKMSALSNKWKLPIRYEIDFFFH